jgi:Thioredoxin
VSSHARVGHTRRVAPVDGLGPATKPRLVFFYSPTSGSSRRVEGFLAQVLQRRKNHDTFELVRVSVERRPDLAEKFRVEEVPTICVVEGQKLRMTIVRPRGCRELETQLGPWLR